MKKHILTLITIITYAVGGYSQIQDTLIDVGGYKLHFKVLKGKGTPIIFEDGASFKGIPWNGTLELIHQITGTTVISYDRAGFGESEFSTKEAADHDFGLLHGLKELEIALSKLEYDKDVILIGHAIGAAYSMGYAIQHPGKVKYMVLLNAHFRDYWTDKRLPDGGPKPDINKLGKGQYYMRVNFKNTLDYLHSSSLPNFIPVIDIIAPIYFMTEEDFEEWKTVHQKFVDASSVREGIIANGSSHYIFKDSEILFLSAVTKAYSSTLKDKEKAEVFNRFNNVIIERTNEEKKRQENSSNSEVYLEHLAKKYLKLNDIEKALEVYELNIKLYPQNWKVYSSLGSALLKAGRVTDAIKMYEKSIELNPTNKENVEILKSIKNK